MISKKMEDALNRQIVQELSSAYVYLAMAAYFEHENLKGFAHWAHAQYKEENEHSMKLFDYINDQNCRVTLEKIATPKALFDLKNNTVRAEDKRDARFLKTLLERKR